MTGAPVLGFVYFRTPAPWEQALATLSSLAAGMVVFRRQFRRATLAPVMTHFLVALFRFR
jgi:hypothetical protein